jgi:excisionase family DNA binding protein
MHRRLQFGMRENPASSRRHDSRLATGSTEDQYFSEEDSPTLARQLHNYGCPSASIDNPPQVVSPQSAKIRRLTEYGLLTVNEVAELLQVPVSWVYERTRSRGMDRLPGFRLGKYWRFDEGEVLAWLKRQRSGGRVSV